MAITAEDLFRTGFLPFYPDDAKADLAAARATDANPANNPSILAHLDDAAMVFAELAPRALGKELVLDFSDDSVHRLGGALTRESRDAWLAEPNFGGDAGTLFNIVVHGSAYVGACIVRSRPGVARWLVRRPLWESQIGLQSAAGEAQLSVFHWWLKSLADDALGGTVAGLGDRYRTHVEVPSLDVTALPVFVADDRRLPRLAKVRYDALYKYLRAHLPELKDVGRDFPSPERFDEMKLRWLDVFRVGEGRMVLFAGPGENGVYLFWLDGHGFAKSSFIPADKFPDPKIEVGERVKVITRLDGRDATHEMLWWGP